MSDNAPETIIDEVAPVVSRFQRLVDVVERLFFVVLAGVLAAEVYMDQFSYAVATKPVPQLRMHKTLS